MTDYTELAAGFLVCLLIGMLAFYPLLFVPVFLAVCGVGHALL